MTLWPMTENITFPCTTYEARTRIVNMGIIPGTHGVPLLHSCGHFHSSHLLQNTKFCIITNKGVKFHIMYVSGCPASDVWNPPQSWGERPLPTYYINFDDAGCLTLHGDASLQTGGKVELQTRESTSCWKFGKFLLKLCHLFCNSSVWTLYPYLKRKNSHRQL